MTGDHNMAQDDVKCSHAGHYVQGGVQEVLQLY